VGDNGAFGAAKRISRDGGDPAQPLKKVSGGKKIQAGEGRRALGCPTGRGLPPIQEGRKEAIMAIMEKEAFGVYELLAATPFEAVERTIAEDPEI
jgi:hypothetical protein